MPACWSRFALALMFALGSAISLDAAALRTSPAPWPQWNGPRRNGVSEEKGLLSHWPEGGPKLVWTATGLGAGYSSVAVAGGRIFTLGARGSDEMIFARDARTGKPLWETRSGPLFTEQHGDGPRGTPTVEGDVLYAEGANGDVTCLDAATGKVHWQVNILERFGARRLGWGQAESPLLEGGLVIVTPGGRGATLAALDKANGETVWTAAESKSSNEKASYASPVAATLAGVRQVVQFTHTGVFGVRAADGQFLWKYDFPARHVANTFTPIVHNDCVFISAAYDPLVGSALVRIQRDGDTFAAREVYKQTAIQSHHGGAVLVGEYLYGSSGGNRPERGQRGWPLTCMEFQTGKVVWRNNSIGKSSLICADGKLFLYSENGAVGLVEATPKGYEELGRFAIQRAPHAREHTWTHPVVADGRLYLRDQDHLFCYDVAARR